MQDLNDLFYYVQVVDHGGFAPASRALQLPKSKLSRRIAQLEARLDTRLIQRSTRQFHVTELGRAYYQRCKAMLAEAEAAQAVIAAAHEAPCGNLRLSCPIALLHSCVGRMLVDFARRHPQVALQVVGLDRPVDVIAEGIDLALRVRPLPLGDSDLTMRALGEAPQLLVAAPELIARYPAPRQPWDLLAWPSLGSDPTVERPAWTLSGPDGQTATLPFHPAFGTSDLTTLRSAAIAGLGVAKLPELLIGDALASGTLVRVLPDWTPPPELIHAVFATRRGLVSSVRALLDHLAEAFADATRDA